MDNLDKAMWIRWRDSQTADGWTKRADVGAEKLDVETVGFIIREDETSMTLAHSLSDDSVNGRITIPLECIVERRWLI